MSYAVKGVTTERGLDVGDFALVAYGGAGPLHALAIARELGIRTVIIPGAPGVFSAFGMLFSDLRYDYVRTWFTRLDDAAFATMEDIYSELEQSGYDAIASAAVKPERITVKRAADMRYIGQEHAVTVDLPDDVFEFQNRVAIKGHFDESHALRYGTSAPAERAEIVSLRATVTGVMRKPPHETIETGEATPLAAAHTGKREVFFADGFVATPTFARAHLLAGNRIDGPALIEEHASTTVVHAGGNCRGTDKFGNLVIGGGEARALEVRAPSPLRACGERVGVRGSIRELRVCGTAPPPNPHPRKKGVGVRQHRVKGTERKCQRILPRSIPSSPRSCATASSP